ncbi:MAG: hypothetical protein AB8C84_01535 [Oligoflexales bacterium]
MTEKLNKKNKELNIIYFIDSARTRSFKLPLSRIALMLLLSIMTIIWTVFSTFANISAWEYVQRQNIRLKDAMAVVFDYQMKYERVYEWAYPESLNPHINEDHPLDEDMSLVAVPVEEEKKQETVVQEEKEELSSLAQVMIESPKFYFKNRKFHTSFVLKNMKSPDLAEGRVWATVKVQTSNGSMKEYYYPSAIQKLENGVPQNIQKSPPFSIRRYKKEECDFPIAEGFVKDITIGLLLKNNQPQFTVIPVQKEINDLIKKEAGNVATSKNTKETKH